MNARSVLLPKTIFVAAMQMPPGEEREAFLTEACFGDQGLQTRVERLISASQSTQDNPLDAVLKQIHPGVTAVASEQFLADSNLLDGTIDVATHPLIGPYKLLEVLGQGGMGAVYTAEQQYPIQREVALKIIRPGMDSSEVIARFEAERQVLAIMDHTNIAKVLDAGTTDRMRPYFVMELVRGIPINEYCEKHKLPLRERLKLFVSVCRAIQHAHQKGVIHRDLKPSNVMVTHCDGEPVPKVIDFGIAKALNQKLTERTLFTQFSQMIGTPLYMSPEQAEMSGLDIDTRSDIYSLGVVLYELLTGQTPHDRSSFSNLGYDDIRKIIREEEPLRPSARLSTLSVDKMMLMTSSYGMDAKHLPKQLKGDLDWIVMQALSKDREQRYKTASEFADDIQRFLEDQPVLACPPSLKYRAGKFVVRNAVTLVVVTITLLSIVIGGGMAAFQAMRATTAERQASLREAEAIDLLEASRLQQLLDAFRNRDFARISELELPDIESLNNSRSGSLRALLKNAGIPQPDRRFTHPASVNDFSICEKKNLLLTACSDGTAYLWNIVTGGEVQRFEPHVHSVDAVAISPDGQYVVTGGQKGNLRVWNSQTGAFLSLLTTFPTGVETIRWSPDGQYLAAGARYSEARVWNRDFEEILHFENDQRHESLLFTPDSQQLYIPTRSSLTLWDLTTGQKVADFKTGAVDNLRTLCWADKEHRFVIAGDRFADRLMIIDANKNRVHGSLMTYARYPQHLAVSPNRKQLATVFEDGNLRIFDLSELQTSGRNHEIRNCLIEQFKAHSEAVGRASAVSYLSDTHVVTSGADGDVSIWNIRDADSFRLIPTGQPLRYVLPEKTHSLIYLSEETTRIQRFDPKSGDLAVIGPELEKPAYSAGDPSRQGWLPIRSGQKIEIREIRSGERIGVFSVPASAWGGVCISQHGRRVAVATAQNNIAVFESIDNWQTSQRIAVIEVSPRGQMQFTDHDQTLVFDDPERGIIEWSLVRRQKRASYEDSNWNRFVISYDHKRLAAGDAIGFQVWNRSTGTIEMKQDDLSGATSFLFCDESRILLTGHLDGRIHAWHLPTREPLGVLFQPQAPIGAPVRMEFFPGCQRIMVHYDSLKDYSLPTTVVILGSKVESSPGQLSSND